jgi:hypothetical protein
MKALRGHLLFEVFWQRLSLGLVGVNGCPPIKPAARTKPLPSAGSDLVDASPSCVFWDGEGTRFNLSHYLPLLTVFTARALKHRWYLM